LAALFQQRGQPALSDGSTRPCKSALAFCLLHNA
jgi:hypothetical protein